MSQGRQYVVTLAKQSLSAAVQDILAVYSGAAMAFEVLYFTVGTEQASAVAGLGFSLKRLSGTITNGSGGATASVVRARKSDAAATVTARGKDTTQVSGTVSEILHADILSLTNGYPWIFPRDERPVIGLGEVCALSLDDAAAGALIFSATVGIRELL